MKIHEYQGKQLLKKFGVNVPRGIHCTSVDDAVKAAETLGGKVWVVKAQIHAGGRGKGGGVKVAKSLDEVRQYANDILGMQLVTHQTGPEGQKVRHLLIEEGADIQHEYYVAALTDRATQSVAIHLPFAVDIILIAVGLAVIGGLLAGAFGGWRASRLSPAEALRSVN